jgi:GNAT superfamily N-acetyltransferase
MSASYQVALAKPEQFAALRAAERAADTMFAPEDLPARARAAALASDEEFAEALRQGLLWSALDEHGNAVGFAMALWIDGSLHLEEICVHSAHQRHGVGRMLVEAVRAHAERSGARRLTLTTFRFVAWNMPWYARLGFAELPASEWSDDLRAIFEEEIARGLPRERRVAMALAP